MFPSNTISSSFSLPIARPVSSASDAISFFDFTSKTSPVDGYACVPPMLNVIQPGWSRTFSDPICFGGDTVLSKTCIALLWPSLTQTSVLVRRQPDAVARAAVAVDRTLLVTGDLDVVQFRAGRDVVDLEAEQVVAVDVAARLGAVDRERADVIGEGTDRLDDFMGVRVRDMEIVGCQTRHVDVAAVRAPDGVVGAVVQYDLLGTEDYLTLLDWRRRVADMYGEIRARLSRDPIDTHRYWRGRRDDLFRNHPQSALPADQRAAFHGLRYFECDPRFAFTATIRSLPEKRHDVSTSDGSVIPFVRFGAVDLPVGTLEVMWLDAYSGGVFLPFADATTGKTTYGGGRYLLDTAKSADLGARGDELVLDFNFAYHPSCAYDSKWACPIAPAGNRLAVAIDAGERLP